MDDSSRLLALWRHTSAQPGGKKVFARLICLDAPCFASIRPIVEVLQPGHVEISMRKRRAVLNGLGHVDTAAISTLAELTGRILTVVSVPATHHCFPRHCATEYLQYTATDLTAMANTRLRVSDSDQTEQTIPVDIRDINSMLVCRAHVTMRIAPRHRGSPLPERPSTQLRDTVFQA